MSPTEEITFTDFSRRFLLITGLIIIVIAVFSLAGWVSGQHYLLIINAKFLPIPPVNAVFFIFFGILFVFYRVPVKSGSLRFFFQILFCFVLAYSILKISGYFLKSDLIFEEKMFSGREMLGRFPLRRMSPYTGLLFALSGFSVILLSASGRSRPARNIAAFSGLLVSLAGFIAVLGYLYGTPFLYSGNIIPLSLRTALLFVLAGSGIICMAGEDTLVLNSLTNSSPYSRILRILVLFMIIIFLLQGVLDVVLAHYYGINEALVLALVTFLSVVGTIPVAVRVTSGVFAEAAFADRERRKVLDELRNSIEIQRLILENCPLGICMVRDDKIQWTNTNFCNIFRINTGACKGISFNNLFSECEDSQMITDWPRVLKNGKIIDTSVAFKKSSLLWLRLIGSAISPEKGDYASIWMVEDMTERKNQRQTMRLLSHTVSSLSECISITDTSDHVIFVNKAFEKTYGYSREEILGKNISVVWAEHGSGEVRNSVLPSTLNGGWNGELINRKKNGTEFPVYLNTSRVVNEKNEIVALVGVAVDITERKEAQNRERLYLEKLKNSNDAKDKLFSIISHDLRSPLSSILGFFQLLADQNDMLTEEEKKSLLSELGKTSEKTLELIDNLLTWSRTQRGGITFSPVTFSLAETAQEQAEVLTETAGRKNILVQNSINRDIIVFTDRNIVKTMILNLLSNAVKFTPYGGKVILSSAKMNGETVISVSDSGVGISPDRLETLFMLDKSTSTPGTAMEKGTGLGLQICKEFAAKIGGRIWAESEAGQGSVFSFTIPSE